MSSLMKLKKRSLTSEMERNVRQMLKLIEEDGDSFAQKAEMYYQKRPELISLVEELYRSYKSLVERYEYVTGELYKNIPSDSDNGSEPPSYFPSPSPRKLGRRISSNRAAGFDFFLGSGGNIGYDGSSTLTDSDDEFDDASSINSYSGFFANNGSEYNGMNKRVVELEIELREVKEKLCMYEENAWEQELRNVNEKLRLSEEEIKKLKIEVEKYKSFESIEEQNKMEGSLLKFDVSKSFESILKLYDKPNLAHKETSTGRSKFNSEKRENIKLQEKLARLKISLGDKDNEIRDLKVALSEAEQKNFFDKARLKTEISKLLGQQTHLEEEIRKILHEKIEMEETLKSEIEDRKDIKDLNVSLEVLILERDNLNVEVGLLKEEINSRDNQIERQNRQLDKLHIEHMQMSGEMEEAKRHVRELKLRVKELDEEIERQKIEILEGCEEKREAIRQLCFSLEHYRNGYNVLREAFIGHRRFPVLST